MLTRTQARDEMISRTSTLINSISVDFRPVIKFDDVDTVPPTGNTPWARVQVLHTDGGQRSLRNHDGRSRFLRRGFLAVEIHTPSGRGFDFSDQIAATIQGGLEHPVPASEICFRNCVSREVGTKGNWTQVDVVAEFEYDEYK